MSKLPTYVFERTFDAPPELVWRTWTEPELFARWYGPNVETVIHHMEPTAGGTCLIEMKMDGNSFYQRLDYTEVTPPTRLVGLNANTDGDWNIAANPMMPDWPRVLLTTVTFEAQGGQTKLRLVWEPHQATEAEIAGFAAAMDRLGSGWGAGMEKLAALLTEMQQ